MRIYYLLIGLCLLAATGSGQVLELKKASPFTAVKWDARDQPVVRFNGEWFTLKKVGTYPTEAITSFCKNQYGNKWKKRFSEDLVQVLTEMGTLTEIEIDLILSQNNNIQQVTGIFTLENRQEVLRYNNANTVYPDKITSTQALEDVVEFEKILEEKSSYIHLTDFNYKKEIGLLKSHLALHPDSVDINELAHNLAGIMSGIGDRHSSVKNERINTSDFPAYFLQLPFTLAPLNSKVVALKPSGDIYRYYLNNFPYVKSIDGMSIDQLLDSLVYKPQKAPKEARLSRSIAAIQQLGQLYFSNNLSVSKSVEVVLTNNISDTTISIQLGHAFNSYKSKIESQQESINDSIKQGQFNHLYKILTGNIGYLSVPSMYHFADYKGLEAAIDSAFVVMKDTKALIIDLRSNPGGRRDLIKKIGAYIIDPKASPWVANVAYLRTDKPDMQHESMPPRFLFPYEYFDAKCRHAIDMFMRDFTLEKTFDHSKFSAPHYMVLEGGDKHYGKPVYILVNENSFSAATVFTAAFKGLPQVTIAGMTTDGSSGNSQKINLPHSQIRVKVSTMLSFQRNGKTLDGHGTTPDLLLMTDEGQVLGERDSQLMGLVEFINEN